MSDRIFIERYFSLKEVGIYSLGYKIAGLSLILSTGINMAYSPLFFKLANSRDSDKSIIRKYNLYLTLIIIFLNFIVAFFSKEILLLINHQYFEAYKIVPLINIVFLITALQSFVGRYIKQSKKTTSSMIISLVIASINILLNFILIPLYDMYGAAYATIMSFFIGFVITYYYAKKKCYFIEFDWKIILPVMSILITLIVLSFLLDVSIYLSLLIKMVILLLILIIFIKLYYNKIKIIFNHKN
ncbi:MAG: hypothetical protein Kow0068_19610 [Marinilabiliales bacterium]